MLKEYGTSSAYSVVSNRSCKRRVLNAAKEPNCTAVVHDTTLTIAACNTHHPTCSIRHMTLNTATIAMQRAPSFTSATLQSIAVQYAAVNCMVRVVLHVAFDCCSLHRCGLQHGVQFAAYFTMLQHLVLCCNNLYCVAALLSAKTVLVALPHVSNILGEVYDVRRFVQQIRSLTVATHQTTCNLQHAAHHILGEVRSHAAGSC